MSTADTAEKTLSDSLQAMWLLECWGKNNVPVLQTLVFAFGPRLDRYDVTNFSIVSCLARQYGSRSNVIPSLPFLRHGENRERLGRKKGFVYTFVKEKQCKNTMIEDVMSRLTLSEIRDP